MKKNQTQSTVQFLLQINASHFKQLPTMHKNHTTVTIINTNSSTRPRNKIRLFHIYNYKFTIQMTTYNIDIE